MNRRECTLHDEVMAALGREGSERALPPALEAHLVTCGSCAETALVAGWLRATRPRPRLPGDASLLWWRAEYARRMAGEELSQRAARPLALLQGAGMAAVFAGLFAILWGTVPRFAGWLEGLGSAAGAPGPLLWTAGFGLAVAAAAVAAWGMDLVTGD